MKKAVGQKPAIIGKALTTTYHEVKNRYVAALAVALALALTLTLAVAVALTLALYSRWLEVQNKNTKVDSKQGKHVTNDESLRTGAQMETPFAKFLSPYPALLWLLEESTTKKQSQMENFTCLYARSIPS